MNEQAAGLCDPGDGTGNSTAPANVSKRKGKQRKAKIRNLVHEGGGIQPSQGSLDAESQPNQPVGAEPPLPNLSALPPNPIPKKKNKKNKKNKRNQNNITFPNNLPLVGLQSSSQTTSIPQLTNLSSLPNGLSRLNGTPPLPFIQNQPLAGPSQIAQARQFHTNRAETPQEAANIALDIDEELDSLNLSQDHPWSATSENPPTAQEPHEDPQPAQLTKKERRRIKLSKKWEPEDPRDAADFKNGWVQRDPNMPQIMLPPPIPTKEYLQLASTPSALVKNPGSRKLLLILDLNGTILCRIRFKNGSRDKYNPWPRKNLPAFIDYIFREHHVAVYSSAMQGTILNLLRATIPPEHRSKILGIFTREDMDIPEKYFKRKVSTFKRLSMVWDSLQQRNKAWVFDQTNTVLIDDSSEKASSEPYNHLELTEYTVNLHKAGDDDALGNVAGYLEEARKWANVSSFIKENPFSKTLQYQKPAGWVHSDEIVSPDLKFKVNHGYVDEDFKKSTS